MTVILDKMNRVVLPKALRDRFGLGPGKELEIQIEPDGIRLRPARVTPALIEKNGLLVCGSEVPTAAWDLRTFIEEERQSRSRRLGNI